MRQEFLKRYRDEVSKADAAKDARASDHLLWLQSESLLDALDTFDRSDTEQALLFEDQMGKAIAGMNATVVGEELLDRWRGAGVSRENLFWRSLAQNQESMESEVEQLFGESDKLKFVDPVALQNRLKKLADLYEKSHAMLDSLANASTGGGPPSGYLVGGAMLINTLGSSLFQSKTAAILDAPLNKLAASVLLARLGRYAQHYRLELRNGKELSRGSTARIDRSTSRQFDKALRAGKAGPMTEIRIGGTLVFLEMWNLHNKLTAENKGIREHAEIVAALLALAAVGVEMGACAVSFAEKSDNAAVQQGARVFRSGLRLGAGVLGGAAAMVGAAYDYADFTKTFKAEQYSISFFFLLRAVTQTGAASLAASLGLIYGQSYLEYLLKQYGNRPMLGRALHAGSRASATLASRMVPMLRIFFGLNLFIVALVLVEIFVLPDDLERYLDHCTFRKVRTNGIVDSEEKEIDLLRRAVGSAI
ncbi:hypothetical protein N7373_19710, partial [Achromobacter mucicolens]|uniref:hypothetical protein n=1 Tax=Achromobacter mucicolens TaxID=1389922 RepID=UPI0024494D3B